MVLGAVVAMFVCECLFWLGSMRWGGSEGLNMHLGALDSFTKV
jgi:hypothetical protein